MQKRIVELEQQNRELIESLKGCVDAMFYYDTALKSYEQCHAKELLEKLKIT